MNLAHLRAIVWLRWRMLVNTWRRGGQLNAVLMTILFAATAVLAVPLFFTAFFVAFFGATETTPRNLLYVWDVMAVGFTFFWLIGLFVELQRSETVSLSKLLHLPISLPSGFAINYLSSLFGASTAVFVPVACGAALGLVFACGPAALLVLPLIVTFLLMISAVTYQFQGWLASLMSNPRRRRTVIVVATAFFILIVQLPSLLSSFAARNMHGDVAESNRFLEELEEIKQELDAGTIDSAEYKRRSEEITQQHTTKIVQSNLERGERMRRQVWMANLLVPIGWLPLGTAAAAEGRVLPALLGTAGMGLIGGLSLWRSYRTTIALYQGKFTRGKAAAAAAVAVPAPQAVDAESGATTTALPAAVSPDAVSTGTAARTEKVGARLLERQLPRISEPVSAVALAGLQSLLRAPEAKMMLLTPVILGVVFGSTMLRASHHASGGGAMLMGIAAIGMALWGMVQLVANQFGFDRDGFRALVLSPVARRDILFGKNLSFLPFALAMSVVLVGLVEFLSPLRWDYLLSLPAQFITMYLLFCLMLNLLAIYVPLRIAPGAMRPASMKLLPGLAQVFTVLVLLPAIQMPTLLPLGIETLLVSLGLSERLPICLVLTLVECAAVLFLYRWAITWQGRLLAAREQRILEIVTARVA